MEDIMGVLVGKVAPDFTATAVKGSEIIENFNLSHYKGKYILLFFYPLDFTFVCPTELLAFNDKLEEFKKRGVEVIAASVDSHFSHHAWLATPLSEGGIAGVEYPIVADLTKQISRDYDVLKEDEGIAYRGLFLIDQDFVVRHQIVNDLPLGRSVEEAIRMVDALQYHEENGEVCPANWKPGEATMRESKESLKEYMAKAK